MGWLDGLVTNVPLVRGEGCFTRLYSAPDVSQLYKTQIYKTDCGGDMSALSDGNVNEEGKEPGAAVVATVEVASGRQRPCVPHGVCAQGWVEEAPEAKGGGGGSLPRGGEEALGDEHSSSPAHMCVICYEDITFTDGESVSLPCQHMFHLGCIREWLWRDACCPSCKSEVPGVLNREQMPLLGLFFFSFFCFFGLVLRSTRTHAHTHTRTTHARTHTHRHAVLS